MYKFLINSDGTVDLIRDGRVYFRFRNWEQAYGWRAVEYGLSKDQWNEWSFIWIKWGWA